MPICAIASRRLHVLTAFSVALALLLPAYVITPKALADQETIDVPFTGGPFAVQTSNTYIGDVTITVSGYGQASGATYTDAFYDFADGSGQPIDPIFDELF